MGAPLTLSPNTQVLNIIQNNGDKKEDSADAILYQSGYHGVLLLSHIYMAYSSLPSYLAGAIAGTATKLLTHFTFSKVKADTETSWEKKSKAFGDASLLAKIFVTTNDYLCLEASRNFHFVYNESQDTFSVHKPFVFYKGWSMGSDLTTRAIRWISSNNEQS